MAFGIAAPGVYLAMRGLQHFAYRIEPGPWVLIGAGVFTLAVAIGTVSMQAVRAARTDPVTTLRSE